MQFLKSISYSSWCLLLSLPLFFIGIENRHDWGDDFAQYLIEADNIANGRAIYASNFVVNPINAEYAPPAYPPGYPLIQAPIVKLFGIHLKWLFLELSFLLSLCLYAGFQFFRIYVSNRSALALACLLCYGPQVLALKYHLLSDLPLMCVMTLYLWRRALPQQSLGNTVLLGLTSAFAFLIRSQAVILLVAELIYLFWLIFFKRQPKLQLKYSAFIVAFTVFAIALAYLSLLRQMPGTFQFYAHLFRIDKVHFFESLQKNLMYGYELVQSFFLLRTDLEPVPQFCYFLGKIFIAFSIVGMIVGRTKSAAFASLVLVLNFLIILLINVQQGLRYLLPILPAYLLLIALALQKLQMQYAKFRFSTFLVAATFLFSAFSYASPFSLPYDSTHTPFTAADSTCFRYLKSNLPKEAIVCSTKPRAVALLANIKCSTLSYTASATDNRHYLDSLGVNYFLCRKDLDWDIIERYLRNSGYTYDTLEIANTYTLYTKQ